MNLSHFDQISTNILCASCVEIDADYVQKLQQWFEFNHGGRIDFANLVFGSRETSNLQN